MLCKMFNCANSQSSNKMLSFFLFPKNFAVRNVWLEECCIKYASNLDVVCELHFEPDSILRKGNKKKLRDNAVPKSNIEFNDETHKREEGFCFCKDNEMQGYSKVYLLKDNNKSIPICYVCDKPLRLENDSNVAEEESVDSFAQNILQQNNNRSSIPCGYIETALNNKLFFIHCFHCDKYYSIWKWNKFISHIKKKHTNVNDILGNTNVQNIAQWKKLSHIKEFKNAVSSTKTISKADSNRSKIDLLKLINEKIRNNTENSNADAKGDAALVTSLDSNGISNNLTECNSTDIEENKTAISCEISSNSTSKLNASRNNIGVNEPQSLPLIPDNIDHYTCKICKKSFNATYLYNNHKLLHMPPMRQCHLCDKKFRWLASFRDHIKTHTNQRDYQCEFCGATFVRKTRCIEHKLRNHSEEYGFHCNICNKYSCKISAQLFKHQTKHHFVLEGTIEELESLRPKNIGESKFYNIIDENSGEPSANKYISVIDPKTNVKYYKCIICAKKYMSRSGLYKHYKYNHGNDSEIIEKQAE